MPHNISAQGRRTGAPGKPFEVQINAIKLRYGTLIDLKNNMNELAKRYETDDGSRIPQLKQEVNDIAFTVPNGKTIGTLIWEPLSNWEAFFDRSGKTNDFINVYPGIAQKYGVK